jgi:hypothetical protein
VCVCELWRLVTVGHAAKLDGFNSLFMATVYDLKEVGKATADVNLFHTSHADGRTVAP